MMPQVITLFGKLFRRILSRETRWRIYKRFFSQIIVSTPQGRFLVSTKDDEGIGKTLYTYNNFEQSTIETVFATLHGNRLISDRRPGTVLDVGANCGIISIALLRQGHMSKAIAIEPEPNNFSLLKRNIELNGLKGRILACNVAASDRPINLEFELSDTNHGDHRVRVRRTAYTEEGRFAESARSVIEVPGKTLDSVLSELPSEFSSDVQLVWIDVQGHEGHAFLGGAELFTKAVPVMAEFWPYGIKRSGLTRDDYSQIVSRYWKHIWVPRGDAYVSHLIDFTASYWNTIGEDGGFENVIFTQ